MKKGIITLLSVLAISLAFTGCGDEGSYTGSNSVSADSTAVETTTSVQKEVETAKADSVDVYVNELGIGQKLGVPPVRPN